MWRWDAGVVMESCNDVCYKCLDSCINHRKLLDALLQVGMCTVSLSAEVQNSSSGVYSTYGYQFQRHNNARYPVPHLTMTDSGGPNSSLIWRIR